MSLSRAVFSLLIVMTFPGELIAVTPHAQIAISLNGVVSPGASFDIVCNQTSLDSIATAYEVKLILNGDIATAGGDSVVTWNSTLSESQPAATATAVLSDVEGISMVSAELWEPGALFPLARTDVFVFVSPDSSIAGLVQTPQELAGLYPLGNRESSHSTQYVTFPLFTGYYPVEAGAVPDSTGGVTDSDLFAGDRLLEAQILVRGFGEEFPLIGATILIYTDENRLFWEEVAVTDDQGRISVSVPGWESDGSPQDYVLRIRMSNSVVMATIDGDVVDIWTHAREVQPTAETIPWGSFTLDRAEEFVIARVFRTITRTEMNMMSVLASQGRPYFTTGVVEARVETVSGSPSHYEANADRITINPTDFREVTTIGHEWGHWVMDDMRAMNSGTCPEEGHQLNGIYGHDCAWSEGGASWFAIVFRADGWRGFWTQNGGFFSVECISFLASISTADSQGNEGLILQALWDLSDPSEPSEVVCGVNADGADLFGGNEADVVHTMARMGVAPNHYTPNTISKFWYFWLIEGYDPHESVHSLLLNRIDFNDTPVWNSTPPNLEVCADEWGMLDLRPFASDGLSNDAQLTFSVNSNSNTDLQASISGGYLEFTTPANAGSSILTVLVSDGLRTAISPTFEISWEDQVTVSNLSSSSATTVTGWFSITGSVASCTDSVSCEWGAGASPTEWFDTGFDFLGTTAPYEGAILRWNTGVVTEGVHTLRLRAHFGTPSQDVVVGIYEVFVDHNSGVVGTGALPTLEDGIAWAQPGDTLFVGSETYLGNFDLNNNIVIVGMGATFVADGYGAVLDISATEYPVRLEGISFERTQGSSGGQFDYGLLAYNAIVIAKNCAFSGHTADLGAAVHLKASGYPVASVFENCSFTSNNVGTSNKDAVLYYEGPGKLVVDNCSFEDNRVEASVPAQSGFGVLYANGASEVNIFNSRFVNNDSHTGYATLVFSDADTTVVSECLFADNSSSFTLLSGTVAATSAALVSGCTFANNTSNETSAKIAAANVTEVVDIIVANCAGSISYSGASVTNAVVFNNASGYADDAYWVANGTNVINEDPLFCDSANADYSISAISPAASLPTFGYIIGSEPIGCAPAIASTWTPTTLGALPPDTVIVGCPCRGDGGSYGGEGEIVVLQQSASSLGREVPAAELSMSFSMSLVGQDPGDGFIALTPSGLIQGNQDMSAATSWISNLATLGLGGIGELTISGTANDYPVGQPYVVELRSPDSNGDGQVNVVDFSRFGQAYPPNSYNKWYDYDGDGQVNLVDNSIFGEQYGCVAQGTEVRQPQSISIDVVLDYLEVVLSPAERELHVTVRLENASPFTTMCFALLNENPQLAFSSWGKDQSLDGLALASSVTRSEQSEIFMGIIPSTTSSSMTIGTAVFDVVGLDPIALAPGDFGLTIGEVLTEGNERRRLAQVNVDNARPIARQLTNALSQNYPNPFNPKTTIAFSLREQGQVSLNIYDVKGRLVRTLVDRRLDANLHRVEWDGLGNNGSPVSSGMYFYRIKAGDFTQTRKMLLLK